MIVVVPGDIAVTSPVAETEAIPGFEEFQGFAAGVAEPVKVDVFPIQADNVPVIVGAVFMLIIKLFEGTIAHPEFWTIALK